jgi:hypothetical protein
VLASLPDVPRRLLAGMQPAQSPDLQFVSVMIVRVDSHGPPADLPMKKAGCPTTTSFMRHESRRHSDGA